jgi:hypothetical protein
VIQGYYRTALRSHSIEFESLSFNLGPRPTIIIKNVFFKKFLLTFKSQTVKIDVSYHDLGMALFNKNRAFESSELKIIDSRLTDDRSRDYLIMPEIIGKINPEQWEFSGKGDSFQHSITLEAKGPNPIQFLDEESLTLDVKSDEEGFLLSVSQSSNSSFLTIKSENIREFDQFHLKGQIFHHHSANETKINMISDLDHASKNLIKLTGDLYLESDKTMHGSLSMLCLTPDHLAYYFPNLSFLEKTKGELLLTADFIAHPDRLVLPSLTIKGGGSDGQGTAIISMVKNNLHLQGDLIFDYLPLDILLDHHLFMQSKPQQIEDDQAIDPPISPQYSSPSDSQHSSTLDPETNSPDISIKIKANRLSYQSIYCDSPSFTLHYHDHDVWIENFNAKLFDGDIQANGHIRQNLTFETSGDLHHIALETVAHLLKSSLAKELSLTLSSHFLLNGTLTSPPTWKGTLTISGEDGKIFGFSLHKVTQNLSRGLGLLNIFASHSSDDSTKILSAKGNFTLSNFDLQSDRLQLVLDGGKAEGTIKYDFKIKALHSRMLFKLTEPEDIPPLQWQCDGSINDLHHQFDINPIEQWIFRKIQKKANKPLDILRELIKPRTEH